MKWSEESRRVTDRSLLVMRPGGEFCFSATNHNRWFSVFVPDELHIEINESAGADLGASCTLLRIAPDRAQRFKSMLERLGLMVQRQPGAFDSSAAITTTARKLAETVSEVLRGELGATPAPDRFGGSAKTNHPQGDRFRRPACRRVSGCGRPRDSRRCL